MSIETHDILKELIPNPELDLRNSDIKIHFRINLGQESIPCLFLLETLLLFLDKQLVLVLYFNIDVHSFAAFYRRFGKYEVPMFLFHRGYIYIYIYIYVYMYMYYMYNLECDLQ